MASEPPLAPLANEQAGAEGPIVRGILAYDIITDRMLSRFDAIGGRLEVA